MSIPNVREFAPRRRGAPPAAREELPANGPPGAIPRPEPSRQRRALGIAVVLLGAAALVFARSLAGPLVLAAWLAALAQPAEARAARLLGDRHRAALAITVALALALAIPLGVLALLAVRAVDGVPEMVRSQAVAGHWAAAARDFFDRGNTTPALRFGQILDLGRAVLPAAAAAASQTAQKLGAGALDLLVLAVGTYYLTAEGPDLVARLRRGLPLAPPHFDALAGEALAVARSLLVGGLLTSLLQGAVAAAVYAALGLAGWPALAALTALASALPVVGSALVWIPLAAALALTGRTRDAMVLLALGATLISGIDNVVRPFLSRVGTDRLHPLTLLVGILGGLETVGPWGLLLGPLVAALAVASCRLYLDGARRA